MIPRIAFLLLLYTGAFNFGYISAQSEIYYLGQNPPGLEPEIFAKGMISSGHQEHSSLCISTDGTEFWWSIWELPYGEGKVQKIMYMEYEDGAWAAPKLASFSGKYKEGGPYLSFDSKRLFFYSRRPIPPDTVEKDIDIWYVERTKNGWSEPINAGNNINTNAVEANPVLTQNNNLYFTSNREQGNPDIYLSRYVNGKYLSPENLGENINTKDSREMFFVVSNDESTIVFSRDNRKFSETGELISGERKLLISFKDEDGGWCEPINMGPVFNERKARFPSFSPDGKYLFFTRYTEGFDEDFYWVDAKHVNDLKMKVIGN